ncbi:hypothetical protein M0R45_005319 [Rubus argutus]|uniref:Uncharacterized protein n=1 Tax=Rubus argutus TaxID=59490 RepID=A0AAW1YME5_RUBAR
MDKFSRRTALFLFWFIIVSLQIPKTIGEEGQQNEEQQQPYFTKTLQDTFSVLQDTVSMLQKSHQTAWDKVKTIISDMQMQFSPPSLDFRADAGIKGETEGDSMGEKVKEAAQKSFETSKHTVEETAKSAADAVGGTAHKTAEKIKETVSSDESAAEL